MPVKSIALFLGSVNIDKIPIFIFAKILTISCSVYQYQHIDTEGGSGERTHTLLAIPSLKLNLKLSRTLCGLPELSNAYIYNLEFPISLNAAFKLLDNCGTSVSSQPNVASSAKTLRENTMLQSVLNIFAVKI